MQNYRNSAMPYNNYRQNMVSPIDHLPNDCMRHMVLAMAYVPWQRFGQTYDLSKALCVGTIFPELDKPFCGKRGVCK